MKHTIKIGAFVRSKYASPWVGVVVGIRRRKDYNPLIVCLVVKDRNGKTPRKRILRQLDSGYLSEDVEPFSLACINKDWFDISTVSKYSKYSKS